MPATPAVKLRLSSSNSSARVVDTLVDVVSAVAGNTGGMGAAVAVAIDGMGAAVAD